MPDRIQLRRSKGWRKPENTVVVSRPSRWGNPYSVTELMESGFPGTPEEARSECYDRYHADLLLMQANEPEQYQQLLAPLRGRHLACWCHPGLQCHADLLLMYANEPVEAALNKANILEEEEE